MKKILVTGGLGYIGSHTCVSLMQYGYTPIVIDNLHNSTTDTIAKIETLTGMPLAFYELDIRNKHALESVFEKNEIDAVIHFAALKAVDESLSIPLEYMDVNISGLITLLQTMEKFNVQKIVFSSSCTVYGQPEKIPVNEQAPFLPAVSTYGLTKQIGEQVLQASKHIKTVSLRYFNPVGAHPSSLIGEAPKGVPGNLLPFLTQTAAGIRPILRVFGNDYSTPDGTAIRDYIHICDLADAHSAALKKLETNSSPVSYEVYNIGTGKGYSVLEIINTFEKATNLKINWEFAPRRPGDVEQVWADTALSSKELGWRPVRNLEEMVVDAWNYQKTLS